MAAARILVVDDEPVVRQLVSSVLTCSGYEVLSAPSGEAALEILKAAPQLDLVLSDVTMPGLQGPELLEQAKQISPSTALMLMSAFPPRNRSCRVYQQAVPSERPDRKSRARLA